ncbi:M20 family metallopeptidase [Brassicibacter mesophilus]|uniref:M20 family metallopeptidase n=1 Tax=Brassicibacter mesophilus TaxID=745119 RepID=UPI003D1BB3DB
MNQNVRDFVVVDKCRKVLESLVKINSTHPEGNEMDVVNQILSYFKKYDIKYKIFDHGNNRGTLVITIPGKSAEESIAFLGHTDTVPVEDYDEWIYPPFDAVVDGEYMYGRGSSDMKGGVTSMIMTALYLLENKITPSKDIHFCFTADEEFNGMGVLEIKKSGLLDNTKEIFIAEPSDEKLGLAEKGALWLEIAVDGLSAHGSRPDLGVNAVEYLIEFISGFRAVIDKESNNFLLGKSTFAVNKFIGGVNTNVIPTRATASLDIRTIPNQNHEDIINKGREIAKRMMEDKNNLTIIINVKNNRPAVETSKDDEFIKRLEKLCDRLTYESSYKGIYFYTDASQIIPDLNVPFVILGPGDDAMAHQRNEKIKLNSVARIAEIYISYILEN